VYEVLPGWQRPTGDARSLADLPSAARTYLDRLQEELATRVSFVSVGTRRDQIIQI
jgi:adenylosuccinate synthase